MMLIRVVCKFYGLFAGSRDISCLGPKIHDFSLFINCQRFISMFCLINLGMNLHDNAMRSPIRVTSKTNNSLNCVWQLVKWQPIC